MHFKTDENKFDLHQGLTKYLFKSGDIFIEKPIIVGYNGPISNKENLSYDKDDIIGEINVKLDSNGVAYIDNLSFIPNIPLITFNSILSFSLFMIFTPFIYLSSFFYVNIFY